MGSFPGRSGSNAARCIRCATDGFRGRYASTVIRAVVFDVGETLVDEAREYGTWADWLGVPRHTFVAMFGAVIAQGRDYRETFQEFAPGFDLYAEREKRAAADQPESFGEDDLYPDVRPTLTSLRDCGLWLGIAGNQTTRAGAILRRLFADQVDLIGTSDDWGAHKPDVAFFERLAAAVPHRPEEILYVGDRVDVDVLPAKAVGMRTALIRRGPWGWVEWTYPRSVAEPTVRITSLAELPEAINALGSPSAGGEG
jgi:HAD superfamily hydrolase (TIGR01549 family)